MCRGGGILEISVTLGENMIKNDRKNLFLDWLILLVSLILFILFFCPIIKISENIPMLGEVSTKLALVDMFNSGVGTMYRALSITYFIFLIYILVNSVLMWCAPILKKFYYYQISNKLTLFSLLTITAINIALAVDLLSDYLVFKSIVLAIITLIYTLKFLTLKFLTLKENDNNSVNILTITGLVLNTIGIVFSFLEGTVTMFLICLVCFILLFIFGIIFLVKKRMAFAIVMLVFSVLFVIASIIQLIQSTNINPKISIVFSIIGLVLYIIALVLFKKNNKIENFNTQQNS